MKSQLFTLALLPATALAQGQRPNVVYILADDMGYGDIGVLNAESRIPTPALDSLVRCGVTFTDCHSNSAVSTPTRYGILTGRYAFRSRLKSGVLVGHSPALIEPGRETVATLLKRAGYATACIGKWHLGLDWARRDTTRALFEGNEWDIADTRNVDYAAEVRGGPADHGFDYSCIIPASLDIAPYVYIENGRVNAPVTRHAPAWSSEKGRGMWYRHGDVADNFRHEDCLDYLTRKATGYIASRRGQGQPFFLYFPLTAPHTPWLPADGFSGRSGAGVYGDFVCMVDDVVRRVCRALEENGLAGNTVVIFTSDNGADWTQDDIEVYGHRANSVFSGRKSDLWEGGHRVPFVVAWPEGVSRPRLCDEVICTTDLLATCSELTGEPVAPGQAEDSHSFLPALLSEDFASPLRPFTIHHSIDGHFAVRQGRWKLILSRGSGGWTFPEAQAAALPPVQLYDMQTDPQERQNLAADHPDVVERLARLCEEARRGE